MKVFTILLLCLSTTCIAETPFSKAKELVEASFNTPIRPFATQDFGRSKITGAMSVIIPEQSHKQALFTLRKKLPDGVIAYIGTTRNLSADNIQGVELVIINSNDKLDILRTSATDGINYDITNKKVIEKLRAWDKKYGIDIWHAESDTIQLTLNALPKDLKKFSNEIYQFCPDIVDQGSGNISDIIDYLKAKKAIYLWWD